MNTGKPNNKNNNTNTVVLDTSGRSRRRVPRRDFEAVVGILLQGQYEIGRVHQVGEGGMMVSSQEAMTEGAQVVLSFFLNRRLLIVVRAVARSVVPASGDQPQRYGFEFCNLNFALKREIRNFVAEATRAA